MANRGRPPLVSDEVILERALAHFARLGYPAMSVRALNAELGLSHEAISQRFGSKSELFRAAVAFGTGRFITDFDYEVAAPGPTTDLALLESTIRAFMVATTRHPALGDLLHHEAIDEEQRRALIVDTGLGDRIVATAELLARLREAGEIRQTGIRELWYLCHGAIAPLHFPELSRMFDPFDGPVDPEQLITGMTAAIMRSMVVYPSGVAFP